MYSVYDPLKEGVAPFGYPRIKAYSQLPMAFRSVSRPSSPLGAKASTKCPSHSHTTCTVANHTENKKISSLTFSMKDTVIQCQSFLLAI